VLEEGLLMYILVFGSVVAFFLHYFRLAKRFA